MWQELITCMSQREVALCIPFRGEPFPLIYWYGITAALGIAIGALYAARHVSSEDEDPDIVWDALLWVVIAALVGARAWYVIQDIMAGGQWTFVKAINPRTGGMHIFGGAFAGMIAMIIYTRIRKVNGWLLADGALMGLLIGQGIGRFGNLVNIELYGPPTGSNWFGILVPQQHRIAAFQDLTTYPLETRFHPTMLYEAFWLFLSFGIVYYLFRNFQKHIIQGVPTGLYFLLAGFGRFIIEFFRPDQPGLALPNGLFLSYSRIVTLVYMIVGIVVLIDRLGYFRIPFIARPQSMKQREKAYDEMLRNRRRKERATEKEKAREERRKARATQGAQKSVESDTEEK